jgi:hypothetical protein
MIPDHLHEDLSIQRIGLRSGRTMLIAVLGDHLRVQQVHPISLREASLNQQPFRGFDPDTDRLPGVAPKILYLLDQLVKALRIIPDSNGCRRIVPLPTTRNIVVLIGPVNPNINHATISFLKASNHCEVDRQPRHVEGLKHVTL